MALPIALQLYSVRETAAVDFADTLRKVKAMGYDGVEFAGIFGFSPEYVKGLCEGIGLTPISAHININEMIADPEKTFADYATIGCKYAAIPHVDAERRPGGSEFEATIGLEAELGKIAKKYGIQLLYHNHDFEFTKLQNGEYGIDYMYEHVPSDLLQTEFDTCWVKVAGEDPAEYVKKYTGRAPVVHLKDFYMGKTKPKHMYALIGVKEEETEKEEAVFEFRPVGAGLQDMPSILDASKKAGAGWVVVEQDEPSLGLSRLECAKMSIKYLKGLNW